MFEAETDRSICGFTVVRRKVRVVDYDRLCVVDESVASVEVAVSVVGSLATACVYWMDMSQSRHRRYPPSYAFVMHLCPFLAWQVKLDRSHPHFSVAHFPGCAFN